jgi:hypothetical protein
MDLYSAGQLGLLVFAIFVTLDTFHVERLGTPSIVGVLDFIC